MSWADKSNNPLDKSDSDKAHEYLLAHRIINKKGNLKELVLKKIEGKRVLDIGICEHSIAHIKSDSWSHRKISKLAKYCLGIDINKELISYLKKEGYNCMFADATSDKYLGEKFDIVNIGDVIEHVNDPVKLLKFAKRHLEKNGQILVSTPNPYFIGTILRIPAEGTVVANLEHISWVTPSLALELSRRAGLKLDSYYVSHPNSRIKKALLFWLPIELKGAVFLYVFKQ
ncbi:Ubiquinone biosynthesis O-methyltransferase [uncultured archaeon]|nr:Ubiquinone biosynthesis O-methyltransferase [uncultured archaeon]